MFKKLLMFLLLFTAVLNATTPTQENVAKLYIATFDRAPDAGGLDYWVNKSGLDLEGIAASFFDQQETKEKYPDEFSDEDFIIEVYVNLFGRAPDQEGFDYWLEELQSGKISRAQFILAVINGAQGDDAKILENKTIVGLAFARDGRNDVEEAYEIMKGVTADSETVPETLCEFGLSGCPNPPKPPTPPSPEPTPPNPGPTPPNPGPTPPNPGPTPGTGAFITTWKTDNEGVSDDNQIKIGTHPTGYTYNYSVDWGDGESDTGVSGDITHTYSDAGTYTVEISGTFPGIYFLSRAEDVYLHDNEKLLSVMQWGGIAWQTMHKAFNSCGNMEGKATDSPDISAVTDMSYMFSGTKFNQNIGSWDVSKVTDMSSMFYFNRVFNQDIGGWDVSSVTNMNHTFFGANAFDQDISGWDVSNVIDMGGMFVGSIFNQNIGGWDVSKVTDIHFMFGYNRVFNQDISRWDVSNVTDMSSMFNEANAFNQDISGWNVSKVTDMNYMFVAAVKFNQDISGWDVSNVTDMSGMFRVAIAFNQDISGWNVSKVTDMNYMFMYATSFSNHDLSTWDVATSTPTHIEFNYMIDPLTGDPKTGSEWGTGNTEPNWP